jgi:hypothetical protein
MMILWIKNIKQKNKISNIANDYFEYLCPL